MLNANECNFVPILANIFFNLISKRFHITVLVCSFTCLLFMLFTAFSRLPSTISFTARFHVCNLGPDAQV